MSPLRLADRLDHARATRVAAALLALLAVMFPVACGDDGDSDSGAGGTAATDSGQGGSAGGADGSAATGGGGTAGSGGVAQDGAAGGGGTAGAGASSPFNCSPPVFGPLPLLKLTEIINAVPSPVIAESPPGDTARLFVGSQHATIRIYQDGAVLPGYFLDILDRVKSGGEQGLLGLAFHPAYEQNGRFFVHYTGNGMTAPSGDTMISEFLRSASDANVADPDSEKIILTQTQPFPNHNGGAIHFRDGLLFIGLGDGGSGSDPLNNGQSLSTLLGKILRIDVDNPMSGKNYGIPSGNMSGTGVNPEIWSYGLRNPWRWSFDACTGDMYIGDVGQGAWEEIDVEASTAGSGKNYGWKVMEGGHCLNNPGAGCDQSGKTLPVAEYDHSYGCSVTGGYVYRGSKIPGLRGWYIFADYCTGRFWSFHGGGVDFQEITDTINPAPIGAISSFGQDGSGELYVTAFGAGSRVYRIDAQ